MVTSSNCGQRWEGVVVDLAFDAGLELFGWHGHCSIVTGVSACRRTAGEGARAGVGDRNKIVDSEGVGCGTAGQPVGTAGPQAATGAWLAQPGR